MRRLLLTALSFLLAGPAWAQWPSTRATETLKRMFTQGGHFGFPPYAADPFTCDVTTRRATYYNTTSNTAVFCDGNFWTGLASLRTAGQTFTNGFTVSGDLNVSTNIPIVFTSGGRLQYNVSQTPGTMLLGTGPAGNSILLAEVSDNAFDFAVAQQTNPTLVIASAVQSVQQRMFLTHNQTQGLIADGANTAASRRPIGLQGGSAVASATTITPTGNVFHVTGTTSITGMTAMANGTCVTLIFDAALTFTDGAGTLRLSANLVTTADDTITLCCDGTNWFERGRSVN